MTRIMLDHETFLRLGALDRPLEICDASGHTLGFFKPLPDRDVYPDLEPLISEAEVARRMQIKEGRTLGDILTVDMSGGRKSALPGLN